MLAFENGIHDTIGIDLVKVLWKVVFDFAFVLALEF